MMMVLPTNFNQEYGDVPELDRNKLLYRSIQVVVQEYLTHLLSMNKVWKIILMLTFLLVW